MVAVDTNVLVYAHREDAPWHGPALEAIRSLAEGDAPWAIPWPCVHEFLSVLTNPRIFGPPTVMPLALQAMEHLMETSGLILIAEGAEHFRQLRTLLEDGNITGPQVHDARIAALCLTHGVTELWSADRDFSRFPRLKVRNPLIRRKAP